MRAENNIEKAPEKVPSISDIIDTFKKRGFLYNKDFGLGYNNQGDFIWFSVDGCTFFATLTPLPTEVF